MTPKQMRKLDVWIWKHVFGAHMLHSKADPRYTCCVVPKDTPRHLTGKVVGYNKELVSVGSDLSQNGYDESRYAPRFTTDAAASQEAVLEKCAAKIEDTKMDMDCIQIQLWNGQWHICEFEGKDSTASAATLPLAICLFAKQLFSK